MIGFLEELSISPYLKAVLAFVFFYLGAKAIYLILTHLVGRLTQKTATQLDDIILSKVKTPIFYLIILAGIATAFNFLPLSTQARVIFSRILLSIVIAIACYLASSFINVAIKGWFTARRAVTGTVKGRELIMLSRKILNFIIFTLLIIFILTLWDVRVTALVASLGIAGFVFGFALRDIFANIFGGIALIADKSFKIGDFIKLESGEVGEIIDIGLRSTRIKSFDEGNEIIVPNNSLVTSKITNYGRPLIHLKMVVKIGVAYGSDIKKTREVLLDCTKKIDGILENPSPRAYFMEMADFSLNFRVVFWIGDFRHRFDIRDKFVSLAYGQLQSKGIKIPFPTRTIHIEK
jgi:MscS family membrane protein